MVLIVRDPEAYEFFALAVVPLIERKYQTAELFLCIVHLVILPAAELEPRVIQTTGVADGHGNNLTLLHFRGIKVTGTEQD